MERRGDFQRDGAVTLKGSHKMGDGLIFLNLVAFKIARVSVVLEIGLPCHVSNIMLSAKIIHESIRSERIGFRK